MWTAARINEFIARFDGKPVAFVPPGCVDRLEVVVDGVRHTVDPSFWIEAPTAGLNSDRVNSIAVVSFRTVIGLETVTSNLKRWPVQLGICAFDLEDWSALAMHAGAAAAVGPFREIESPLREWILRAANDGHSIRIGESGFTGPCLEAAHVAETTPVEPERAFGTVVLTGIVTKATLPALIPAPNSEGPSWLAEYLQKFATRQFGCGVKSEPDGVALAAGVWQMNGFLDRSHNLAQSVEGKGRNRAGDYWHAIMHRREPDYSNAKYWFRRVGAHGIHSLLANDADDILSACNSPDAARWRDALLGKRQHNWNSLSFVDMCEHVAHGHDGDLSLAARQIQMIEMALLLSST